MTSTKDAIATVVRVPSALGHETCWLWGSRLKRFFRITITRVKQCFFRSSNDDEIFLLIQFDAINIVAHVVLKMFLFSWTFMQISKMCSMCQRQPGVQCLFSTSNSCMKILISSAFSKAPLISLGISRSPLQKTKMRKKKEGEHEEKKKWNAWNLWNDETPNTTDIHWVKLLSLSVNRFKHQRKVFTNEVFRMVCPFDDTVVGILSCFSDFSSFSKYIVLVRSIFSISNRI